MNYYVLPGVGIYGGIKVGFQFAELLADAGVPIAVATPEGRAPQWFSSQAAVVDRGRVLAAVTAEDRLLFSLPHDYEELKRTGAQLVFHCQGTDPLIDPVLKDEELVVLTCWKQARDYVRTVAGREPLEVGISVSDCFFHDGSPKVERLVAYMPRRGQEIGREVLEAVQALDYLAIEGLDEESVAESLFEAEYFMATSVGEYFGLPALEAMAAGCVILSVPVLGGMEYLVDGETAVIAEPKEMAARLAWLSQEEQRALRCQLRQRGMATARRYHPSAQSRKLVRMLEEDFGEVLSWTCR